MPPKNARVITAEVSETPSEGTPSSRKTLYSKLLSVEEYGKENRNRKTWEINEVLRVLRQMGNLDKNSTVLGVGAGTDPVGYFIAPEVRWVFMTDIYADSGNWSSLAPSKMLTEHHKILAGYGNRGSAAKILPLHRDGRDLGFPDNSFDAIYSLGSIEHFGSDEEISQSAAEIGRVLKPGGIAVITTEFRLSGEGNGWPGVRLFTLNELYEVIVKPSKLDMITRPSVPEDFKATSETLATEWPLDTIIQKNNWPPTEGVLSHRGYTFTSVLMVMVKER